MSKNKKVNIPEHIAGSNLGFAGDAAKRTITGKEIVGDRGQLYTGDRDSSTGQRFEAFVQGVRGNAPTISEGTDTQRDIYNTNQANIASGQQTYEDSEESATSILTRLMGERDGINSRSSAEDEAIRNAGRIAGDAYNAQIEEARHARKQTLPQDVVRAGQRGGFESTQMAGAAAIQRTDPATGEAFVGAGGLLDESRQAMDRNISMIVDAQKQAIRAAEAAERKYIKTGKREDYNDSIALVKLANDMENDKETIRLNREQFKLSQMQEQRLGASSEFDIISNIAAGQTVNVGGRDYTGIAVEDIDPFWTASSIVSMMKALPEGESKKVYDPNTKETVIITGIKEVDDGNKVYKSENQNTGVMTFTTVDKDGNVVNQSQAKGGSTFKYSAPSASNEDKEIKAQRVQFGKDIEDAQDDLMKGQSWNSVFSKIYDNNKLGEWNELSEEEKVNDKDLRATIDEYLNKDYWSQDDAYVKFKKSTQQQIVAFPTLAGGNDDKKEDDDGPN